MKYVVNSLASSVISLPSDEELDGLLRLLQISSSFLEHRLKKPSFGPPLVVWQKQWVVLHVHFYCTINDRCVGVGSSRCEPKPSIPNQTEPNSARLLTNCRNNELTICQWLIRDIVYTVGKQIICILLIHTF